MISVVKFCPLLGTGSLHVRRRGLGLGLGLGFQQPLPGLPIPESSTDRRQTSLPSGATPDAHAAYIIGLIDDENDITLHEMVLHLCDERSVIGRSAHDVRLRKRVWTLKKTGKPQQKNFTRKFEKEAFRL